jgi:decaprenylphospho-beta-D-ribofuranose 2-oxidase
LRRSPAIRASPVGGSIAADAHGKNPQRDGTFCDAVEALTVYHPARGYQTLTRQGDAEAFDAACGGFGLTGTIVDATLRLAPAQARKRAARVPSGRFAGRSGANTSSPQTQPDFAYTWHDGTARGGRFGRGAAFVGHWTDEPCAERGGYSPMSSVSRAAWPVAMWNRVTMQAANALYRRLSGGTRVISAFDADFPFARQTLYHRLYGRRGLAEVQLLVAHERLGEFTTRLGEIVAEVDPPLVLLSMKRFTGRTRALAMSGSGMLVALDLARGEATTRFCAQVDALAVETGAQPNAAKDSRLPAPVAAATLPHYARFRDALHRLDPDRLYESELSRRLAL